MHSESSHTGISRAMLRLSHFEVPVGNVPSGGRALTGKPSPCPEIIAARTSRTNEGAREETGGRILKLLEACFGTCTSWRLARVASTAAKFLCTTASPSFPYDFLMEDLIAAMASSRGSTPLMAKKQVCMMVFMREPIPVS